jgi:NitT/TauT family transport system ATP-binding protein
MKNKLTLIDTGKLFEDKKRGDVEALSSINCSVAHGEFFCIIGPSGCGKSTLLQLIAGLEKPTSGQIIIDDTEVDGPRIDCGFVFQEYALFPWKTVQGNVEFGPKMKKIPKLQRHEIADRFIELTGLKGFESRYPDELSGGMKQRVAIARALANEPQILLMDEPFAAVDAQLREILQQEILQIWHQTKQTVLFVTHQIEEAIFLADRILIMSARPGRVKEIITVGLPRPRHQDIRTGSQFQQIEQHIRKQVWQEVKYIPPGIANTAPQLSN